MSDTAIWPLATEEERNGGWTLNVSFMQAIRSAAATQGADVQLEDVEGVLLAAEAHALQALATHEEQSK